LVFARDAEKKKANQIAATIETAEEVHGPGVFFVEVQ